MILKKCLLIVQNSFFFRWKYNFVWKKMCIPLNFHLDNVNVHRRCVELICLNSDSVKCRILGNGRLLVCSTCIQLFLNQYFVSSSVYSIRLGIYAYIDIIIRVLQINSYWTIRTIVFLLCVDYKCSRWQIPIMVIKQKWDFASIGIYTCTQKASCCILNKCIM